MVLTRIKGNQYQFRLVKFIDLKGLSRYMFQVADSRMEGPGIIWEEYPLMGSDSELNELLLGLAREIDGSKDRLCVRCSGSGSDLETGFMCRSCHGQGVVFRMDERA